MLPHQPVESGFLWVHDLARQLRADVPSLSRRRHRPPPRPPRRHEHDGHDHDGRRDSVPFSASCRPAHTREQTDRQPMASLSNTPLYLMLLHRAASSPYLRSLRCVVVKAVAVAVVLVIVMVFSRWGSTSVLPLPAAALLPVVHGKNSTQTRPSTHYACIRVTLHCRRTFDFLGA